jgi:uncharacterized beta-barrel protein YwiB (DUF1934 family)
MLKRVRVALVTDRTQMVGSLFSGTPQKKQSAVCERTEMMVSARYHDDGTRVSISWQETESSGLEGSTASVSYQKSDPAVITMLRTGTVKTALVFERGCRHHCIYRTPVMPFEVAVMANEVQNDIEKSGTLYLEYAIELRGADAEHTRLRMTLLPDSDTP